MKQNQTVNLPHKNSKMLFFKNPSNNKGNKNYNNNNSDYNNHNNNNTIQRQI